MHRKKIYVLTKDQKRMYAAEKLTNFRSIFKLLATRSSYVLKKSDLVSPEVEEQISTIGQFAEVAYSTVPLEFLFQHFTTLVESGFPLEYHQALQTATLLSTVKGTVGRLPAFVMYRSTMKQLVIAISGTSSLRLALHDLRTLMHLHPSRRGRVHSGFWALYKGLKPKLMNAIAKSCEQSPDVDEIVITGHSMGGSVSYLLAIGYLAGDDLLALPLKQGVKFRIVVFGTPRTGDANLVAYWRELVATRRKTHGPDSVIEHSVKAYNDGIPALPPFRLGFRHFSSNPMYLDGQLLYYVPESESEHTLFDVALPESNEEDTVLFPKGGHNYYNLRDLEMLIRRLGWLTGSKPDKSSWEDRYRKILLLENKA